MAWWETGALEIYYVGVSDLLFAARTMKLRLLRGDNTAQQLIHRLLIQAPVH